MADRFRLNSHTTWQQWLDLGHLEQLEDGSNDAEIPVTYPLNEVKMLRFCFAVFVLDNTM